MKDLPSISPSAVFSELLPKRTVFAPRTTLAHVRWVFENADRLDALTGAAMSIMGDTPLICHKNTASDLILDFFRRAGIEPASNIHPYETEKESTDLAKKFIDDGEKIIYVYPPPPEISHSDGLVVSVSLYNWLNDKANLPELVKDEFLPPYRMINPDALNDVHSTMSEKKVFIKACNPGASGSGTDVFFCPNAESRLRAKEFFFSRAEGLTGIRVEEAMDIGTSWCLNLAIGESSVRYLGAAIQLFSGPAKQCGSLIDPDDLPPSKAINIALDIAEKARAMGYQGIAGFDIGRDPAGRLFVFDLNFRLAASTSLVLLHDEATRRTGTRVSQSWNTNIRRPLESALKLLLPFSLSGQFVPTRLFEGNPQKEEISTVTGMITANSVDDANATAATMEKLLGHLL